MSKRKFYSAQISVPAEEYEFHQLLALACSKLGLTANKSVSANVKRGYDIYIVNLLSNGSNIPEINRLIPLMPPNMLRRLDLVSRSLQKTQIADDDNDYTLAKPDIHGNI